MNIYEAIKKDHRKVLSLLDQLIASEKSGPETWGSLVQQVRDELVPHSRAEEAILYNALRDHSAASDTVAHSYGEHAQAEAVLRGLQISDALNVTWVAAARSLREALAHHIEEEEDKVFTAARRAFSDEEAKAMGAAFTRMKTEVRGETFAQTTAELISNLLPTRLRETVRRYVPDTGRPSSTPSSR